MTCEMNDCHTAAQRAGDESGRCSIKWISALAHTARSLSEVGIAIHFRFPLFVNEMTTRRLEEVGDETVHN